MDVPEPVAGPGEMIIEVHNAGVCGTDIHIFKSEYIIDPPVILGHELCGTIAEVGQGVRRFKPGERVTINPSAGKLCGHCRFCRVGAPFFCVGPCRPRQHDERGFCEVLLRERGNRLSFAGELGSPGRCAVRAFRLLLSGGVRVDRDRAGRHRGGVRTRPDRDHVRHAGKDARRPGCASGYLRGRGADGDCGWARGRPCFGRRDR